MINRKKKTRWILAAVMILLLAAGCGKKDDQVISDNRISGNEAQEDLSTNVINDGMENISGSMTGDVSGDFAGSISENVSGNETGNVSENTTDSISENGTTGLPETGVSEDSVSSIGLPLESGMQSNCIYIANMSGKDIEFLTLTFSEGETAGREILNGEILMDGSLFTYMAADMNALQQASSLKLTVTATAKDETVMEFPQVRVINPSGCTVILSRGESTSENQAGYEVYIE